MIRKRGRNNRPAKIPTQSPSPNPTAVVTFGQQTTTAVYQGPIPPPEFLKQYDTIVPGAANRILQLAESQSSHRQQIEKVAVEHELALSRFGQRGALFIATLGIAAGAYIASRGQTVAGTGVIGGAIGAIAIAYLTGTFSRYRERKEKAKIMAGLTSPARALPKSK